MFNFVAEIRSQRHIGRPSDWSLVKGRETFRSILINLSSTDHTSDSDGRMHGASDYLPYAFKTIQPSKDHSRSEASQIESGRPDRGDRNKIGGGGGNTQEEIRVRGGDEYTAPNSFYGAFNFCLKDGWEKQGHSLTKKVKLVAPAANKEWVKEDFGVRKTGRRIIETVRRAYNSSPV